MRHEWWDGMGGEQNAVVLCSGRLSGRVACRPRVSEQVQTLFWAASRGSGFRFQFRGSGFRVQVHPGSPLPGSPDVGCSLPTTVATAHHAAVAVLLLLLFMASSGDVVRAPCGVMHGKTSPVFHTNKGILEGLEK